MVALQVPIHAGFSTGVVPGSAAATLTPVSEIRSVSREGRDCGLRWRELGPMDGPPVVVLGGISADRRVDSWWSRSVGAGRALDPEHLRLLSFDWPVPEDGSPACTGACADALAALLERRGIAALAAAVGSSFGAMVALAFAARHPDRVRRVVAIGGAHRSLPSATAGRVLQREIIRAARARGDAAAGVALARALALTSYRPPDLTDRRFFRDDPKRVIEELQSYFEYNGGKFARDFDADRYLALSEALDRHRVDPIAIRCPVDLIGAESDHLVPFSQLRALAGAIGLHARLHRIESEYGHDAFLKSPERINPLLTGILGHLHPDRRVAAPAGRGGLR